MGALVDQTRAIDALCLSRYLGTLTPGEYAPVRAVARRISCF